jgi:hypothetical protein
MRRWATGAALAGLVAFTLGGAAAAAAQPGLIVGITDGRFLTSPSATMADAQTLGLGAVHLFLTWQPGQTAIDPVQLAALSHTVADSAGERIVVTVDGKATDAPTTSGARAAYCSAVGNVITRFPSINDIVIWNEPNVDYFWQPQYGPDGSSEAPSAYEALLAQCYDVLHALRPGVNVILSTSPGGNDNPHAASNVSFAAGTFIEDMGAAYRRSGRTGPIFDTIGHSAYGASSAESPWQQHLGPGLIGEGDLDHLIQALDEAFGGTGQAVPGDCTTAGSSCPTVWYLEDGWQTIPDAAHAQYYTGSENDGHPLPDRPVQGDPSAPTQSSQITAGVELAYCQPYVGAFFNFLLQDEPDLEGWQSGVLWANGDAKTSFDALRQVIAKVRSGAINCSQLQAAHAVSLQATASSKLVDRVEWPALSSYSVFNTVWTLGIDTRKRTAFRATLAPVRASQARGSAVLTASGTLPPGRPTTLTFPPRAMPAGRYRITVVLTSSRPRRTETLASPAFSVG